MSGNAPMQNPGLKVTALAVLDLAKLLSKSAGKSVTAEMIRYDIEAGAPVNADGTVNLVHYAAWLVAASPPTLDFRLSALDGGTDKKDVFSKAQSPKPKATKPEASDGD